MKTAKEFLEALKDDAFFAQFKAKFNEMKEGSANIEQRIIKTAEALGFSITEEDVKATQQQVSELSEDELGKITGGLSLPAGTRKDNQDLADVIC